MTFLAYSGLKNTRYTPGRKIGQGGEGAVFEVQENTSLVVKIYTEALDSDKTEKLLFMASIVDAELTKFAAWPLDIVRDNSLKVCGFIMKKLEGFVPLHMLFSPMERKKLFPDKGYNFLVHVSRNLATAFYKIHKLGIVVGDVNEANILVSVNGMVALIDCDSFQIKNGNRYHFCEVGIPRYTPPELLERGSFTDVIRTGNTDSFSLATLIFQLLFLGRAPFTGINLTNEDIDEEKAIKAKEFAYSLQRTNKKLFPAKNSLELKYLSPGVINSFHAAFEGGESRPTPRQWINDLDELGKEIILCSHSKIHYYPKNMQQCPWCMFKEKAGIVYFLDDSYLKAIPQLNDIEQFINGFKLQKLEIKKLNENYKAGNLTPIPIDKKFYSLKNQTKIIFSIILLITIALCLLYNWACIVAGAILIFVLNTALPARRELKQELTARQRTFDTLKNNFESIIKKHNQPPDINKYNQSATRLTGLINSFRKLPLEFSTNKKKIEEKYYNLKYDLYLQNFEILNGSIPSFGTAKKNLIYNNGIRTAADIRKLNSIKINGIGPKNIQILNDWQRHVGANFTYIPDVNSINYDVNIAANEIAIKKQKLEVDIKLEYKVLLVLRANILSAVDILEHQYNDVMKKLYQAELDLQAFKKFNQII